MHNPKNSDLVISVDTAERWLKRISVAGTFAMGMLVGVLIKWWLS